MDTIVLKVEVHTYGAKLREEGNVSVISALVNRGGFIGDIVVKLSDRLPVGDVCKVSHIAIEDNLYPLCLLHQLIYLAGLLATNEHYRYKGQEYTKYCPEHA